MSRFLGREEELAALAALLGRCRLITLTGAPGVGKTRLAREIARSRPDRAAFVDLAPVGEAALVPRALASALSVQEVAGQGLMQTIVAHLRRRPALVVLDNCEHLVGGCAELVDSLLDGCPELSILATSRQPLAAPAERLWPVAPLALPDHGDAARPDVLMGYPAVRLLVERAVVAEPGFVLSSYVAPAVAEICRRLDGIPLAIELAAARVDMLTPAEIAARLDARFDLLRNGPGRAGRHQTLEAALDWSHDLLSAAERALLRRLSVFVGSFDLKAAEAVCAGAEVKAGDVRELLAALVSKSLVRDDAGPSRQARYRLLETIRAYASDRLEQAGEAAGLRKAHARCYLALAEAAEPELTGSQQARWLERLDDERDNLRRSIEWSLGHGHSEWALRLTGALVLFWRVRCHFSEGRGLLDAALRAGDGEASALRARALWGSGFMTLMAGDGAGAVPSLEQSLSAFRRHRDPRGCARALLILANCAQFGPGEGVLPLLDESAALAREAGDLWCLSHALGLAGFENLRLGELPAARARFEESVAVARLAQDNQGLRIGLIGLGAVLVDQGDYRSAETQLEEALAVAHDLDEDYGKAHALSHLGDLALGRGEHVRAGQLVEEALALLPEVAPSNAVEMLVLRARVAHAQGDRSGARLGYEEALARIGATTPMYAHLWMCDLALDEGEPAEGRRRLEHVLGQARSAGAKGSSAQTLHRLGLLARDAGDVRGAATLHREALELQQQIGATPAIVASVEALAGLAADAGSHHRAARLLGAADSLRRDNGYARLPWESARHEADLDSVRRCLPSGEVETTLARGAGLAIGQAVTLAVNGCGGLTGSASGWASLTEREQHVAKLAAEGLTNPEIAERLVVSRNTVKFHLAHVFSKLGITRRVELRDRGDGGAR